MLLKQLSNRGYSQLRAYHACEFVANIEVLPLTLLSLLYQVPSPGVDKAWGGIGCVLMGKAPYYDSGPAKFRPKNETHRFLLFDF
jgi:hypothetical protein